VVGTAFKAYVPVVFNQSSILPRASALGDSGDTESAGLGAIKKP
jgi:hypothetical protein